MIKVIRAQCRNFRKYKQGKKKEGRKKEDIQLHTLFLSLNISLCIWLSSVLSFLLWANLSRLLQHSESVSWFPYLRVIGALQSLLSLSPSNSLLKYLGAP